MHDGARDNADSEEINGLFAGDTNNRHRTDRQQRNSLDARLLKNNKKKTKIKEKAIVSVMDLLNRIIHSLVVLIKLSIVRTLMGIHL